MPSSTLSLPFHKIIAEEEKALEDDEPQDEGAWAPELLPGAGPHFLSTSPESTVM